jgi:CRISPR system Cascade subunit CasE
MILSRLTLNPRSREGVRDLADCQELHRTILSAFPAVASAPRESFGILFRIEYRTGAPPAILVQSRETPNWSLLPRSYLAAPAESKDLSSLWDVIENNALLRFRLRANPTRKINTKTDAEGIKHNGKRVELRTEQEQLEWLRRKGSNGGFEIVSVQTASQVPDARISKEGKIYGSRSDRYDAKKKSQLTFASVLFEGKLRVSNLEKFRNSLEQGVGSAKAYGFGLLSVAPVV